MTWHVYNKILDYNQGANKNPWFVVNFDCCLVDLPIYLTEVSTRKGHLGTWQVDKWLWGRMKYKSLEDFAGEVVGPEEGFLRLDKVMELCGMSQSHIYKLMSEGKFPRYTSLRTDALYGWKQISIYMPQWPMSRFMLNTARRYWVAKEQAAWTRKQFQTLIFRPMSSHFYDLVKWERSPNSN